MRIFHSDASLVLSPFMHAIVLYALLNMLLDRSGAINLTDQNVFRRVMHMFNRLSVVSNRNFINPYCVHKPQLLNAEELKELQEMKSLQLLDTDRDVPFATRMGTSTIRSAQMSDVDNATVARIIASIQSRVEETIGAPIYEIIPGSATIYRYFGPRSKHDWHVDPYNVDSIVNLSICIGRKGNIAPFQFKDGKDTVVSLETQEGDAVIFKGGVTVHRVPANDDETSIRTVLIVGFTTDKCFKKPAMDMCTYINGGKNVQAIITSILKISIVAILTYRFSGVSKYLSTKAALQIVVVVSLVARLFPLLNLPTGTGRPVELFQSAVIFAVCVLLSMSIKGGSLFFAYYMLTDQVLEMRYL